MRVALEGNPAHYLIRVMRVAEGDTVILCDDATGEWAARVGQVDKRRVDVTVVEMLDRVVPVEDDDDVDALHERIKVAERAMLVDTVGRMAREGFRVEGRRGILGA